MAGSQNTIEDAGGNTASPLVIAPDIPAPSQLPRSASYTSADRIQLGAEFDHALPTNQVLENGNYTIFRPHYDPETNPLFNGMAYTMHRFSLAGYLDEPKLTYHWILPLELFDDDSHWLGLANWAEDRWNWFACDASCEIELDNLDPYIRPGGGDVIVVPLVYRNEDTTAGYNYNGLQFLRFGDRVGRWVTEIIDDEASAWMVSMAMTGFNIPHVAYMDGSLADSDLKYATMGAGGWMTETLDSEDNTGWYPSVTTYIDINDIEVPLICFRNHTSDELGLARCTSRMISIGGIAWDWTFDVWTFTGAWSPQYAETAAYRGICYFDAASSHLIFSYFNGLSWVPYTIDDSGVTGEVSRMLLDSDGLPCIVYTNSDNDSIQYAHYTGSSWALSTIEDSANELGNPHFAFAPDGTPNVSYHDYTHDQTIWAWFDGLDWQREPVYDLEAHGDANDIVVDSTGTPHIASTDIDHNNLIHFWRVEDPGDWLGEVLEAGGANNPCSFLDMEIDPQNRISIAYSGYYDGNDRALKFAYQVD